MRLNIQSEKQIINQVVKTAGFLVILILVSGDLNLLKGYLFALLVSFLMFFRTMSTTKRALELPEHKVRNYMTTQYIVRYFVYAGVLGVAILRKDLRFSGAVMGLLTIKIGLLAWAVWQMVKTFYQTKIKKS